MRTSSYYNGNRIFLYFINIEFYHLKLKLLIKLLFHFYIIEKKKIYPENIENDQLEAKFLNFVLIYLIS